MRRWMIEVGYTARLRMEYNDEDREAAMEMAFELARKTGEPVTVRYEEDTEDDIPV